jgi:hypothetical protein
VGDVLSIAPQNRCEDGVGVRHASRSSGLLRVEASQARVFQFVLKLVESRRQVVHVASSRRWRRDQVEDGRVDTMDCVGPFYPKLSFSMY